MQASSLRGYPLHKPVVSVIRGACFAAGFEIMLGTDIRIASDEATFCLPEVKRGVVPFAGSMVRLPRQIPYCRAMEILITGEPLSAQEAQQVGLINRVLPGDQVLDYARQLAATIAANAPLAV
jgi:enoyl-CoA hydratase